jgi:hypothetical protein
MDGLCFVWPPIFGKEAHFDLYWFLDDQQQQLAAGGGSSGTELPRHAPCRDDAVNCRGHY